PGTIRGKRGAPAARRRARDWSPDMTSKHHLLRVIGAAVVGVAVVGATVYLSGVGSTLAAPLAQLVAEERPAQTRQVATPPPAGTAAAAGQRPNAAGRAKG